MHREDVVDHVVRFYLAASDFNGCPLATLIVAGSNDADLRSLVSELITSEQLEVLTESISGNPHIKQLAVPSIGRQIEAIEKEPGLQHVCLYPHPRVLKTQVDPSRFDGRPYALELALGCPQLEARTFDLAVLEFYRNDPRYQYSCDDVHGWISIADEYDGPTGVAERDQILLPTFGFAYNNDLDRAVTAFVRYLANLTAEHQQVWRAKQLGPEFMMHPDYYRTEILGEWPERIPLFTAFWMELELINVMTEAMGRPRLFCETTKRPPEFSFLIRPTRTEFDRFVHVLDKLISDNINRKFFEGELQLDEDFPRDDGKVVVRQKGTLTLIDEWFRSRIRLRDWTPFDEAMKTFREVRRLRQKPAHALTDNAFDQWYFHEQRDLMKRAYAAVRTVRQAFGLNPATSGIEIDEQLRRGEIADV